MEIQVSIPDGSTLAQIRSLVTSVVIVAAWNLGITVTASQVLLPAIQQGA